MDRFVYIILLLGVTFNGAFAASYNEILSPKTEILNSLAVSVLADSDKKESTDLKYVDGFSLRIMGKYHPEKNYNRLPAKFEEIVRPAVWSLSKNSSGISIHFTTNSPVIAAKWKVTRYPRRANMAQIGTSGLDLYCLVDGNWQYVNSAVPSGLVNEKTIISDMDTAYKEFIVNLPLYDGVEYVEIGIEPGFSISTPKKSTFRTNKPIVFYGTSITQGASASRPGMAYPSIISRKLNVETMNFGFSGNGRFEESVGEALCETGAGLIVLDCTPNSSPETIKNNAPELIKQIRACNPEIPILLVESIVREYAHFRKSDSSVFGGLKYIEWQNQELRNSFLKAVELGMPDIYYLESDDLIGADHEATVDGTHLSDLGMVRIAEKISEKIVEILNLE
jgi:hypothetical protein